jgi:septal ring factor EnvC (AmiA/AmiB activator)
MVALLVITTLALLGLSLSFVSAQSNQLGLLTPRIDVEATARAIHFEHRRAEVEKAAQERLLNIKAQINQKKQTLSELEQASQTQDAQLATLQVQIAQYKIDIERAQAVLTNLQQAVRETETNARDVPATDEPELPTTQATVQQSLPVVSTQLQVTSEEQAQPPASVESPIPESDEENEHSPVSHQDDEAESDQESDGHDDDESDRESDGSDGHDDDEGDGESDGHDDEEGDGESDEHDDD